MLVAHPFVCLMESRGWDCVKTHGNQFQAGFPDYFCTHEQFSPRWVETKVVRNGMYSFTPAQIKRFPLWHKRGVQIYVVAAEDLRGEQAFEKRKELYALLFQPPNVMQAMDKWRRK